MKRRRCICNDCGVDIVKAGEYVMLDLQIWDHEIGLDAHDNLCIGCVEKRLGRRIKGFGDITNMQNCGPMSLRLQVRVFGRAITKRKPYRLKAGSNISWHDGERLSRDRQGAGCRAVTVLNGCSRGAGTI